MWPLAPLSEPRPGFAKLHPSGACGPNQCPSSAPPESIPVLRLTSCRCPGFTQVRNRYADDTPLRQKVRNVKRNRSLVEGHVISVAALYRHHDTKSQQAQKDHSEADEETQ